MYHRMLPQWTPGVSCVLLLAVTFSPLLAVESRQSNQQNDTPSEFIQESKIVQPGSKTDGVPARPAYKVGPVAVDVVSHPMKMTVENLHGRNTLSAQLGVDLLPESPELQCRVSGNSLSIEVSKAADLRIRNYQYKDSECVDVSWRATSCVTEVLTDCLDLGKGHWYGGSELREQLWPLEKVSTNMMPFMGTDSDFTDNYGPVQERMFFNSDGHGIYIDEDIPLFVSINATGDKKLCLQAKYDEYWYSSGNVKLPELNYTMCTAPDVRSIHQLLSDRYIKKPAGMPNPLLFRTPIWATWSKYKTNINQSLVINFVNDIKKNNFTICQIGIDDVWTPKYGDLVFDPETFPDPKSLVDTLHSQGIAVALWVHPFVNIDTQAFPYLASKGWMIPDISGARPALTTWWNGKMAGHIDFSNPGAVQWYLDELNALKTKYGIDTFKFDAGDVTYLPPIFKANQTFPNRNHYTRLYATAAHHSDTSQNRVEVRTGLRTQNLPIYVRALDKKSIWTFQEGFRTIITNVLTFGLLGYPFILPDYIGGNSYGEYPDPELFIRWVQANALMPLMQFSLEPWVYNNSTVVEVAQEMVQLHAKYADKIIGLANDSITTGYPINRPLWWIAPMDEAALTVDDQFLLGDDVLVAPVVEQAATMRRIYLPAGRWRDELKGQTLDGGKWVDYAVTLRDLPHFTKVA